METNCINLLLELMIVEDEIRMFTKQQVIDEYKDILSKLEEKRDNLKQLIKVEIGE